MRAVQGFGSYGRFAVGERVRADAAKDDLSFIYDEAVDAGLHAGLGTDGARHVDDMPAFAADKVVVPFGGGFIQGAAWSRVCEHDEAMGQEIVKHIVDGCAG